MRPGDTHLFIFALEMTSISGLEGLHLVKTRTLVSVQFMYQGEI
jgi:hypothetical protein